MAVGSVVNAINILRVFATGESHGVNAVARSTSISPSTCFNILKTLVDQGFLAFDPMTKAYSLGSEPGRLFGSQAAMSGWTAWVGRSLEVLARECDVTCGLWMVTANRVILQHVAENGLATRIHLSTGQRLPIYIGAMGRCIAADQDLPPNVVSERIATLRWQSPPTGEAYWNDMQQAKQRGWAIDEGSYLRGVTTAAAPVRAGVGNIRYCVTSSMFTGQHDPAAIRRIGDRTSALAVEASERLTEILPNSDKSRVDP